MRAARGGPALPLLIAALDRIVMRLLAFGDDAVVGRAVVQVAETLGLKATFVTNLADFRRSLVENPPQIILLDLLLATTDGVEQLRFLSDQHYTGSLILITDLDARVLAASATVARNLGFDVVGTLCKPVQSGALRTILERSQSSWRALKSDRILEAIRGDELSLDFQPIVTRWPRALKQLEALVRWEHPTRGLIPPGDLLPVVEASGELMDEMSEWTISAVLDVYKILCSLHVRVPLALNLSYQCFHDRTFPERLERRLEDAGMPASDLILEISETAIFRNTDRIMDTLTRLRMKGVHLAIDNFGSGYSSLKALRQLPFSEIKIDRSFITDMATSDDSMNIAKAIIDLAATMGMTSVAVGVETEKVAELVEHLGVHALQGYFVAAGMPAEAIPAWQKTWMARDSPISPAVALVEVAARVLTTETSAVSPIVSRSNGMPISSLSIRLSPRQIEVMRLLSQRRTVKEIARELELGPGTVKVHLAMAYAALGAHNRTEALTRAKLIPGVWDEHDGPSTSQVRALAQDG